MRLWLFTKIRNYYFAKYFRTGDVTNLKIHQTWADRVYRLSR